MRPIALRPVPHSNWGRKLERARTPPLDQFTREGFILVKLDLLGDTSVSLGFFFFFLRWWQERLLRAPDALLPTPATHQLACTHWASAEGGWPRRICQTFLAILGRADLGHSLSLKIQLSFCLKFHFHLLSQVAVDTRWGLRPRARSSRAGQTGSKHVATYREQNTGLRVSMEQCANCSDG